MPNQHFEAYGRLAQSSFSPTQKAGRYSVQSLAERRILQDVVRKLDLGPGDRVLDIGCGAGLLAVPMCFLADRVTAVDHPDVVDALRAKVGIGNLDSHGGDFMEIDIDGWQYDKVIAYGVLQYQPSIAKVVEFFIRGLSCLSGGGRMLIGDLPNVDKKQRFLSSEAGQKFLASWNSQAEGEVESPLASVTDSLVLVDDDLLLRLMKEARMRGYESYLLRQPPDLPFGHTREDLLVTAPS